MHVFGVVAPPERHYKPPPDSITTAVKGNVAMLTAKMKVHLKHVVQCTKGCRMPRVAW